jgi:hypothetical protein
MATVRIKQVKLHRMMIMIMMMMKRFFWSLSGPLPKARYPRKKGAFTYTLFPLVIPKGFNPFFCIHVRDTVKDQSYPSITRENCYAFIYPSFTSYPKGLFPFFAFMLGQVLDQSYSSINEGKKVSTWEGFYSWFLPLPKGFHFSPFLCIHVRHSSRSKLSLDSKGKHWYPIVTLFSH